MLLPADRLSFGAATASYQVEGGVHEDGRGPSIWDTFTARPGTIRDGSSGEIACDSFHRYPEDIELLSGLGAEWYRFSVAWPRIVPEGTGRVEQRGLDYYDRLVDGLLDRGIRPMATLYHWDLPQPLEDAGGWPVRATAEAFAEYAAIVHERLADRVPLWATLNEPWVAAYLGYAAGVHAPGRAEGPVAHKAAHHLLLGHALAAEALRDQGATGVGTVLNLAPIRPVSDEDAVLGEQVDALRNRIWLGPLIEGAYDEGVLAVAPELRDPELVRDGDLERMAGSLDWLGINYYTPVRPQLRGPQSEPHPEQDAYPGAERLGMHVPHPRTDIGWEIDATGLTEVLEVTGARAPGVPLVIAENGGAFADEVVDGPEGRVIDDADRVAYLRDHLAAVHEARGRGVDVRGYMVWTLLDNFEWAEGYTKTFGIVHVDPLTQDRTPKASYHWLASGPRELRGPEVAG